MLLLLLLLPNRHFHRSDSDPLNSSHDSQGLSELAESKEEAASNVAQDQAGDDDDGNEEALLDMLSKYIQYITENPGLAACCC